MKKMELNEIRSQITPEEVKTVAGIHGASKSLVYKVLNGTRVNDEIVVTARELVTRRRDLVANLRKARQHELGLLMGRLALNVKIQ